MDFGRVLTAFRLNVMVEIDRLMYNLSLGLA